MPALLAGLRPLGPAALLASSLWSIGCTEVYPEIAVVNRAGDQVLLRDLSFNGCSWPAVLAGGDATWPSRCPPGRDRVHFQRFDASKYCAEQARDGTIDGVCACDGGAPQVASPSDPGVPDDVPRWFAYQTISEHTAGYGDFLVIELGLGDMEEDFAAPGAYGH